MKEADVQKWVQKKLKDHFKDDIYIFKVPQGQYTSRRGIPDLVAGIQGKFVAIEVKTEVGKLTKIQSHELVTIKKSGSIAAVIYGKDIERLNHIIRFIEK